MLPADASADAGGMEALRPILRKLEAERETPWGYGDRRLLLAPMVRVNTLPFRLLAAECGADVVYSEELVDRSVLKCERSVNGATGFTEFRHPDGKLIFSTVPHERIAFQLGSACGATALRAAQVSSRSRLLCLFTHHTGWRMMITGG